MIRMVLFVLIRVGVYMHFKWWMLG